MQPPPDYPHTGQADWLQTRDGASYHYQIVRDKMQGSWQKRLAKGKGYAKRGAGLLMYGALGLGGLFVVLPVVIILLVAALLTGHALLVVPAILLLLVFFVLTRLTNQKASQLVNTPTQIQPVSGQPAATEGALKQIWQHYGPSLPDVPHAALAATIRITREALHLTASDIQTNREKFDVQQAISQDLPELLRVSSLSLQNEQAQQHLLQQLYLIEQRMSEIVQQRRSQNHDHLQAHGRYLQDKYQGNPASVSVPAPDYSTPLKEPQPAAPTAKSNAKRSELDLD